MRISSLFSLTLVTALAACSGATGSLPGGSVASGSGASMARSLHPTAAQLGLWPSAGPAVSVCGAVPAGSARCLALVRTDIKGMLRPAVPAGYGPSDLQTAYNLTSYSANNGSGQTVAIVDAYDDPNAEADLGVYRAQYGLSACTTANGCFSKVKQGSTANVGWAEEESLDVDMVSAICPNCHIILVEAASATTSNLTTAEKYATAHANYVSNSWSGSEGSTAYDSYYNVAGVAITAATGDSGHNRTAQWPAILPSVIGVGGTSLTKVSPRTESAWSGAGSGSAAFTQSPASRTSTPDARSGRKPIRRPSPIPAPASRCTIRMANPDGWYSAARRWQRRSRLRSSRLPATPARTTRVTYTRTLRV